MKKIKNKKWRGKGIFHGKQQEEHLKEKVMERKSHKDTSFPWKVWKEVKKRTKENEEAKSKWLANRSIDR